jgi:hypothetical protein
MVIGLAPTIKGGYAWGMIPTQIDLDTVDFEEEVFRITEDLNLDPMIASIEAIGQQSPALLWERSGSHKVIICGFRRLHALREMGRAHANARILPEAELDPLEAYHRALFDNLSHRKLNALEKARVIFGLKNTCKVEEDLLIKKYLPLLELEHGKRVLHQYLSIMDLHPRMRALYKEGKLTLASIERIACMPGEVQNDLPRIFDNARLSSSLQRKFFDLVEDVAAICEVDVKAVLVRPELSAALEAPGLSQFQKGERIFDLLCKWRNPRLSQAEENFGTCKRKLALPGSVSLLHDSFFESRQLTVEFTVSTPQQFREVTAELQRAGREPALDELMRMK